jgi:thiol-disulfide isomerase/thioredoxin
VDRSRLWILIVAVLVLSASACSSIRPGAPSPRDSQVRDFAVVAYQGESAFGGEQGRFSQVFAQNKPVVLNFWAGQCPPCRAEMPEFQKVADEYKDSVLFVGVDVGQFTGLGTHDDARAFCKSSGFGIRPAMRRTAWLSLCMGFGRCPPRCTYLEPERCGARPAAS